MEKYDVIVIGSGVGMNIIDEAVNHDMKVALVDKGPLGGTCPNLGCIPSKVLITVADRIVEIQESKKLGVTADIVDINFRAIMNRMRKGVRERQSYMKKGLSQSGNPAYYQGECHFVRDYVIKVGDAEIQGDKFFIACGTRPAIPPIKGLEKVKYLTNETVLKLKEMPEKIVIIGGGYIGVEYAHFFSAMGSRVTLLEMTDRLIAGEEPAIADLLKAKLSRRMQVMTGVSIESVRQNNRSISVSTVVKSKGRDRKIKLTSQHLMIATGRKSNADTLKLENTGIDVDDKDFIKVDKYFETTKKNIYAVGDISGKYMFTHVGNREASIAAENLINGEQLEINYHACPHAIYSYPQIASVGMTEKQAKGAGYTLLVGTTAYMDVAKGEALMESDGFVKIILNKDTADILGCHIIGPYAPILIQEVVNAMTTGGQTDELINGIHIHPAMPEVIQASLSHLEEV